MHVIRCLLRYIVYSGMMPTNAELNKELEHLRIRLDKELAKKNDDLIEAITNEVGKAVAKEVEELTKLLFELFF